MTFDEQMMQCAWELAMKAQSAGEVPIGAVVVLGDQIVGRGENAVLRRDDPTAHAEILAIREAALTLGNYRLTECALYTTLEPCAMCAGAIMHARIARLVIGAADAKRGAVLSNLHLFSASVSNHAPEIVSGILEASCSAVLSDFFRMRREEKRKARQ